MSHYTIFEERLEIENGLRENLSFEEKLFPVLVEVWLQMSLFAVFIFEFRKIFIVYQ